MTASPGAVVELPEEEVHLWVERADGAAAAGSRGLLSREERERAARLRNPGERRRWAAARGLLRRILANYTGAGGQALVFRRSAGGKPELLGPGKIEFSLSHSGELVAIAVARAVPVGVDVERVRHHPLAEGVLRRCFSFRERRALERLSPALRPRAFLLGWTRKEAYAKAVGSGVWRGLAGIEVAVEPGRPARYLALDGDPVAATAWWLRHLEPSPGYVGALAVAGGSRRVVRRRLERPAREAVA